MISIFDMRPRGKVALLLVVAVGAAFAQTPPTPSVGASATPGATEEPEASEAMKRSRRMAENPYRWIKMHAEPKRKPDAVKQEPAKPEPVKPRAPSEPVTADTARSRSRPPEAAATAVAQEVASPKAIAEVANTATPPADAPVAAPAVAVAAPTSASAPAETAASAPTPDDANDGELRPLSTPPPVFPRELRGSVSSGRVTVAFTVQPDGAVGETSAESSTNRRLARAALDAVKQWKFEPMASAVTYKVEFDFKE